MPYKSIKQERFFNVNKSALEKQGVNVNEWNAASKGEKLPMRKLSPSSAAKIRSNASKALAK
jgi:hypothetical protein